ncbi:unnamed protein product [Peronospora belbahrii]|uniref:Uncharacterized protein n=1 Tax=Peronospora belbahrii TaxID=622444 RepID=A0AAU9KGW3_9STRA|nr:unnamed protein product [Peronospora belbahrii]CAH0516258.1 unnamed protein product [Peronospora belbahrii]
MKAPTTVHSATEHRPCFAARVFTLIFKRRQSVDKSRPKSWSGQPTSASVETLARHTSARSMITRQSGPLASEVTSRNTDDDYDHDSSWRKRQTHCANCGRLFFVSLSALSCGSTRFCSLDCKTTFEYVKHLEELLAEHMLKTSSCNGSSSDEDDYKVEEVDVEKLLTNLT